MNKKLIAAIAATTMAGAIGFASVAAAEATFYGRVVAGAVYTDGDKKGDDGAWNLGAVGEDSANNGFASSRFGFKGETDLGNGMSAGFKIEREIDGGDALTQRHNLVYLSGGWGKLTLGNQWNPYLNARHWDQTNFNGGWWGHGEGYRHEGINYSMSSGPFSLNIMATAHKENTPGTTPTVATPVSNTVIPATVGDASDDSDSVDGWIFNAAYNLGAVVINVGHHATNKDVKVIEAAANGTSTAADLETEHIAGRKAVDAADASRDNTAIGINGSVGRMDWYLAYQTSELNTSGYENDVDSIGGFLSFNVGERDIFYVYRVNHSADRISYDADGDEALGKDYTESIVGYSRSIGPGVKFIAEYETRDTDLGGAGSKPSILALAIKLDF